MRNLQISLTGLVGLQSKEGTTLKSTTKSINYIRAIRTLPKPIG